MNSLVERMEIPTTSKKSSLLHLFFSMDKVWLIVLLWFTKHRLSRLLAAKLFVDKSQKAWTNKHVSSYLDQQISCHHTIPAEIAEKIVEKIKLQQEFREAHGHLSYI
jgi:hypothetical protein